MGGWCMSSPIQLSVVVPVWNENELIGETYSQLKLALESSSLSYQLIFVDDGSSDGTSERLREIATSDPDVVFLRLTRNFGQHPAVLAGFEASEGELVATIDADLQNPPGEILKLVSSMTDADDVAVGVRSSREDGAIRRVGSRAANWMLVRLGGLPSEDYGSMLRVYRRKVVDALLATEERGLFITALTAWMGYRHVKVLVDHRKRLAGTSKYSMSRLARRYVDLVVGFSDFPLQAMSWFGFVVAVAGFAVSVLLGLWRLVYGPGVSGLVLSIAFLVGIAGVQLLSLGIVGQYLGRVLQQVYGRPQFVVAEAVGGRR